MQNEIELLLTQAKIDHIDTIGGVDFNVGTLCGQNVVIAKAGIGKILSSAGITAMSEPDEACSRKEREHEGEQPAVSVCI